MTNPEEHFRQLAEHIQAVFWIFDPVQAKILYLSPTYERIWGRSREELYANPLLFLDTIVPADRSRIAEAIAGHKTGAPYDEEYAITRPDGTLCWVHDCGFPLRDASGQVYRMVGIAQDITARRRRDRLSAQSERMTAVGQLAAGVSHEINNPLSVILGFAQALVRRTPENNVSFAPLRAIEREAFRCRALVQDLLTFSRTRQPGLILQNPLDALAGALSAVETPARLRGIQLCRRFNDDVPALLMDAAQIQKALINLCANAIDAMPEGGTLTLSLERQQNDVVIGVADTGIGIPPHIQSRIFEPFFTTKEIGKGTGLGLSMAYEIIRKHNGQIEVQSRPGQGATFWITLPLAA